MRLHRLALSAFGPFADRIVVDLDALGADGLFLLHGHTGAGKTSLLDAVAFALFGSVPGARDEAKRLRCDTADPDTPTEVELEATIAGRRIVITRSPQYERPKRRGSGSTTQQASVSLRWLDTGRGAPQGLTRAAEVGAAVGELLGMTAAQFFQVVLLPQGEFARFLRADTKDRQELLERLFDTARFARIEAAFGEHRLETGRALAEADSAVAAAKARVLQAAGIDAIPSDEEAAPAAGSVTRPAATATPDSEPCWLPALEARASERAEVAAAGAQAARADAQFHQRALDEAERADAVAARVIAWREEQVRLAAEAEADEARGAAIAAAERAAEVLRADGIAQQARANYGAAVDEVTSLSAGILKEYRADDDSARIRQDAARLRERAGAVGGQIELEERQVRDRHTARQNQGQIEQLEEVLAKAGTAMAELPEQLAAAHSELIEAGSWADRAEMLAAAAASAQVAYDAAAAIAELTAARDSAAAEADSAAVRLTAAQDLRRDLVERRIAGIAAELAGQLRDGQPCPVCGSADHPGPAAASPEQVDAAAVRQAEEQERLSSQGQTAAHERLTAALQALDSAVAAAAGHSPERAAGVLAEATAAAQRARLAAAELPELRRQVDARTADLAAAQQTHSETAGALAALRRELAQLDGEIRDRGERIAAAAGPFDTIAQHRDHLLSQADLLDRWAEAHQNRDRSRAALLAAEAECAAITTAAGFGDVAAAAAAADLDLAAARAARQHYRDRLAVVTEALSRPEHQLDITRIDLDPLRERQRLAAEQQESATAAATLTEQRSADLALAAKRLRASWRQRQPVAAVAAEAAALAEVIAGRGQNAKSLSLRAYVLARKLQQVAEVASTHLRRMSAGRYRFAHNDSAESRGRAGGLGLDIVDAYSGQQRSAKTLSGGESFLASLALALALADVVAAESGARLLDTIFIDEGFGSLDADTLELVMATLDELRAGGRVVGVVSHVDDMRQRIPNRLLVRKDITGSTVEITAG